MQLRDYQRAGIEDIRSQFRKGIRRVCYVLPCGGGKTLTMANMAINAEKKGNLTTFIVHRQELLEQAAETLYSLGCNISTIQAGQPIKSSPIKVASIQTLARRLDQVKPPDVIILDEAHHATAKTWKTVIDYYPNAYIVGLTATPARLGGQGLSDVFETLVIGPAPRELIQQGHLSPYKYYAPPMVADLSGVKTKMGDFDNSEITHRMDRPAVIGDAVQHYIKLAAGKRAIAYCASRRHSENTAEYFRSVGISAKHIDGETPKAERKQAIEDFRTGKITVLTNVDLISEGFDCPGCEVVILLRPTQSLTLYIQQAMRGMRPDRGNPFKCSIMLDHVGNVFRHGLPDEDREWSLEGVKKRKRDAGAGVSIRQCENCFSVHAPADICPYCGFVYKVTVRELIEKAGELVEFTPEQKKSRRVEIGRARTYQELLEIERARGYKPGWARIQAKIKGIRG